MLFSHGPLSLWKRHTRPWQEADWFGSVVESDHVRVDRPGRWPPLWPKRPGWDRWVQGVHGRRLLRSFAEPVRNGEFIAMLFYPTFFPCVEWLKPRHVVYHVYDVYRLMDDWSPAKAAMEARLTARADLITASSAGMARSLPGTGPERARVLNNGADSRLFESAAASPCPADLAAIPGPRIGYVGNINPKLDLEMVQWVADRRPEWQWVFLGPVYMDGLRPRDHAAKALWESCLARPNVHFLGLKSRAELPAYVNHMDVNTICYRVSLDNDGRSQDWVAHGYPTKLHEYLATGRPVVASPQEAVKQFQEVLRIAATPEVWEAAIVEALAGGVGTPERRRATARDNTWDRRVDQLEGWLSDMVASS